MRKSFFFTLAAPLCSATALAHDGHGMGGTHWHVTDLWGFVIAAVLVAAVFWRSRK